MTHCKRRASYCSKACQKSGWRLHKTVCKSVAAARAEIHSSNLATYDILDAALTKWCQHWTFALHRWVIAGIDLSNYPLEPDRVAKHTYDVSAISLRSCQNNYTLLQFCGAYTLSPKPSNSFTCFYGEWIGYIPFYISLNHWRSPRWLLQKSWPTMNFWKSCGLKSDRPWKISKSRRIRNGKIMWCI